MSLNGPAMMDLGHCEKLYRQGISEACHPNLEVGRRGSRVHTAEMLLGTSGGK